MYHGKYEARHLQRRRKRRSKKTGMLFLSLLLVIGMVVGGTVAWLSTKSASITNTFLLSHVSCSVTEEFNGTTKSNVNVINTGDIDAYIRVKLVTYRVNDEGDHIGGIAKIPPFTPGNGWVENGDYYYYTQPVAPDEQPAAALISSIDLIGSYTDADDADGGKQVIEVMAEAIQANGVADDGTKAVVEAWGVDPETLSQGGAGK